MAQRWSITEDIIICQYCIQNPWAYSSDYDIKCMMSFLKEARCPIRSRGAIKKRAYAFELLLEGRQSPSIPKQIKNIYYELEVCNTNSQSYKNIKSYIKEVYNPNDNKSSLNIGTDNNTSLIEGANNTLGYQRTIDYGTTFPMILQKYVELKGIKTYTSMCKKIGMKPDTFSAILRGKYKEVKKENVLKICIGLELSTKEAEELLLSAGYALSNAIMTDVVVKAFLWERRYSVVAINAELYENNEPMLFKDYVIEYEELLNN